MFYLQCCLGSLEIQHGEEDELVTCRCLRHQSLPNIWMNVYLALDDDLVVYCAAICRSMLNMIRGFLDASIGMCQDPSIFTHDRNIDLVLEDIDAAPHVNIRRLHP